MRTCLALLGLALPVTLACTDAGRAPASDSAPRADSTPPAQRADSAREIYIDSVVPGNPLVVMGRARTFENTVQVRVLDASGETMTEVYETSVGEMGNHNPFTARVWLGRDPGSHVTVQSFEYSAKDGSVRSLTSERVPIAAPRTEVAVDFATAECTETKTFRRSAPSAVAVARLMVEILVAGPTAEERAQGATHPFPPGARVRSVNLRDGVLTVDFDERLQNVGGACKAQAIRTATTRTLARLPSVREVIITAGGSRDLALQP